MGTRVRNFPSLWYASSSGLTANLIFHKYSCPLGWSRFWLCGWLGKQALTSTMFLTRRRSQNYYYAGAYVSRHDNFMFVWTVCQTLGTNRNISRRYPVGFLGQQCRFLAYPQFPCDYTSLSPGMYPHTWSWAFRTFQWQWLFTKN